MRARLFSWSVLATVVAALGLAFSAGAIAAACLDYQGESYELLQICADASAASTVVCPDASSAENSGLL